MKILMKISKIILKIIWILACMSIFSSCSKNSLFLKYADSFISFRLNSDFDLSRDQKKINNKIVEDLVSDFKKTSLPEIRELTKNIILEFNEIDGKNQLEKEVAYYSWLLTVNERIKHLFTRQLSLVAKYSNRFSINLYAHNWANYQNVFKEKNSEILKDKKNKSFANSYIRDIFDDLTAEQEELLVSYVNKYPSKPELRVENRLYQLRQFNNFLGNNFTNEKFELALNDRLKNPKAWNLPKFQAETDQRVEDLLRLLARLFSISNGEQKKVIAINFGNLVAI